jgi:hypothetical protein
MHHRRIPPRLQRYVPFLLLLAGAGFLCSAIVTILAYTRYRTPTTFLMLLLVLAYWCVLIPSLAIAHARAGKSENGNYWSAIWSGAPAWMDFVLWALIALTALLFLRGIAGPQAPASVTPDTRTWTPFCAAMVLCFAAAFHVLYVAATELEAEG